MIKTCLADADSLMWISCAATKLDCLTSEEGVSILSSSIDLASPLYRYLSKRLGTKEIKSRYAYYNEDEMLAYIKDMHQYLLDSTGCDKVIYYIKGSQVGDLGKLVNPYYKSKRPSSHPTTYSTAKSILMKNYDVKIVNYKETDKQIVWDYTLNKCTRALACSITTLASIDKDLLYLVPGIHFNYTTNKIIHTSSTSAALMFGCMVLSGDGADNILGVKGYGEVNPLKLKKGGTYKHLLEKIAEFSQETSLQLDIKQYDLDYYKSLYDLHSIIKPESWEEAMDNYTRILPIVLKACFMLYKDEIFGLTEDEIKIKFFTVVRSLWQPMVGGPHVEYLDWDYIF